MQNYPLSLALSGDATKPTTQTFCTQWQCNKRHGMGSCAYSNGMRYEGMWEADLMHGSGKLTDKGDKNCYAGDFEGGLKHGQGIETTADGHHYEGEFREGRMHGRGKMTYKSGDVYEGEWARGKQEGTGEMKNLKEGWSYAGEWHKGRRSGKGVIKFANGDRL